MNQTELADRIRLGEDSKTEFKEKLIHVDELAASIVCLANVLGGDLIFGVTDKNNVVGLSDVDRVIESLENVSRQNVEPPIPITWEKTLLNDKILLIVHIPQGPQRPYRTNRGVYYIRVGRSCRIASRQEVLEMYQSAGAVHADETTLPQTGISNLDLEYLSSSRPEIVPSHSTPNEILLRAVNILGKEGLTLGGFLCFGRNIEHLQPYARVTFIRFKGVEVDQQFEDRTEVGGRLDQQFRNSVEVLSKHLGPTDRILQEQDPKEFIVPMDAAKEALVNALLHRDYFQNAQVRLFLFSDRLEVISPGHLLNSVTVEAMRTGFHIVRNPIIFSHFARLKLATDAGLGIPNMIRIVRGHGLPEPEILPSPVELRIIFRFNK